MDALVQGPDCDLPSLIITECQELLAQIAETTEKITMKTKRLKALADETDTARRLQTMPASAPPLALAVEALPLRWPFRWPRLSRPGSALCPGSTPREERSVWDGSKAGQTDIRRLLDHRQ